MSSFQLGPTQKVKGLAAPSNLSMNQTLEGHSGMLHSKKIFLVFFLLIKSLNQNTLCWNTFLPTTEIGWHRLNLHIEIHINANVILYCVIFSFSSEENLANVMFKRF